MTLSFVKQVAQTVSINNIQEEVAAQIAVAREEIGLFEGVDSWVADNMKDLPSLVDGVVTIKYNDERLGDVFVDQSLSESIWLIAFKQMQYHLSLNYSLLRTAIINWMNDSVYETQERLGTKSYHRIEVAEDSAEVMNLAKDYVLKMIEIGALNKNLVKKVIRLQAGNDITTKVYDMTEGFEKEVNVMIESLRERASMKCKPLTYAPAPWTSLRDGIAEGAGIKLIKGYKLKREAIAAPVLEAVNKLQAVRFVVAQPCIETARNMLMNASIYKNMDCFDDKEINKEAFNLYQEILLYEGKEVHFPITMDTRGRMYYRGGLLTPQGVDFCKAAFQFAEFKPLGEHGFKAMCIHLANTCGQDKLSTKKRIKWVQINMPLLMSVNTHMDVRKKFKGADTHQALVAIKELQRLNAIDSEWSEKTSNLVCHQDGTCNGLQHMAAITGDRKTAESVNCTPSTHDDVPTDIYMVVALRAAELAHDDSVKAIIMKYGRAMAKNPVMVTGYGAQASTIRRNISKFLASKGEDMTMAMHVGEAYEEAINSCAGAVTQLTEALKTRVEFALVDGVKKITWQTADGFLASTLYTNESEHEIRVGTFHCRKRGMGKPDIDMMKTAQAMSPNFVHSIDATHLRMVVNACDWDLVTVHDSIGAHPCNYFGTSAMIRQKFAMVHNCYDALGDLCKSLKMDKPEFPRVGDYNANECMKSAYIFS